MLLGTLAATFLGDMLVARAREGVIRAANGVFLVGWGAIWKRTLHAVRVQKVPQISPASDFYFLSIL